VALFLSPKLYSVGHKKCATILDHNSHVSWWIFTLIVPMDTLQRRYKIYKIYNFTLIVSPHYLIKLKPHKTAHFEVSRHSILLLTSKKVCELSELFFTSCVQNVRLLH